MSVYPWFKCYPGQFLKGIQDLSIDEQAFYIQLVMRMYDAGDGIHADGKTIARWCKSNERKWNRVKASLIEKNRIIELPDGVIVDERAIEEMYAYCTEEKNKVSKKFSQRLSKLRTRLAKLSKNISETSGNSSMITSYNKEEEYRKEARLTPDGVNAFEILRGACGGSSLQLRELSKLEHDLAGWNGEAFIVSSKWARDRFAESLRIPLKATGIRIIYQEGGLRLVANN